MSFIYDIRKNMNESLDGNDCYKKVIRYINTFFFPVLCSTRLAGWNLCLSYDTWQ